MINRIVKMTFQPEKMDQFLNVFNDSKDKIRNFPGCKGLKLLQDKDQPHILFTYSLWELPDALEAYRQSELFQSTWAKTKILFKSKAEAWSAEVLYDLNEVI